MFPAPRDLLVPLVLLGPVACSGSPGDEPSDAAPFDAAPSDGSPDTLLPDAPLDGGVDGDSVAPDVATEDAEADSAPPLDSATEDVVELDGPVDGTADVQQEGDAPIDTAIPAVCGDGLRDPESEECDDGLDGAAAQSRACTSSCTVVDRLLEADPQAIERRLGQGRHPSAGGPDGHAVAFLETAGSDAGSDTSIAVLTFSPVGELTGMSSVAGVLLDSDPVLATLPDGDYALAYASFDGDADELGITLCRIPNAGGPAACAGSVTETTAFSQRAPDLIQRGAEIVLGWEDESTLPRRICTRRFDGDLQPLDEELCRGIAGVWQSTITLGATATAWREDDGELSVFAVELGSGTWITPAVGLPPADDALAVAALGNDTTLVVYGDEAGVLHGTVLDGVATSVFSTDFNDLTSPRATPSLALTGDEIYLAWREPSADPDPDAGWDPAYEELWLQKLGWDGVTLDTSAEPIPLPRMPSDQTGDQRSPTLAAVPYSSGGAVLAAWNHAGRDVIIELVPTPVLRKTVAY